MRSSASILAHLTIEPCNSAATASSERLPYVSPPGSLRTSRRPYFVRNSCGPVEPESNLQLGRIGGRCSVSYSASSLAEGDQEAPQIAFGAVDDDVRILRWPACALREGREAPDDDEADLIIEEALEDCVRPERRRKHREACVARPRRRSPTCGCARQTGGAARGSCARRQRRGECRSRPHRPPRPWRLQAPPS